MILLADIFRYLTMSEMLFSVGYVVARLLPFDAWHQDKVLYLTALAVFCYSIAGVALIKSDIGQPLYWHTPVLFVAASALIAAEYYQYRVVKKCALNEKEVDKGS